MNLFWATWSSSGAMFTLAQIVKHLVKKQKKRKLKREQERQAAREREMRERNRRHEELFGVLPDLHDPNRDFFHTFIQQEATYGARRQQQVPVNRAEAQRLQQIAQHDAIVHRQPDPMRVDESEFTIVNDWKPKKKKEK